MPVIGSDQLTPEELQLATRNHGMPLEALRHEITPVGLHYLLVHYDIPYVDPSAWRLELAGRVERPLSLSLEDLRAQPAVTIASTMECAGNGRAGLSPRPLSQPWLVEAVGTAEWTGVPLAGLLDEAVVSGDAVEVLFTGLDRGVEGSVEQNYERSLSLADARGSGVVLAYEMNGAPLPAQHGFPLRLLVPGWYGMTNVKWLTRVTVLDEPFTGYQQASGYRLRQSEDEDGAPVTRMLPRSLIAPPGIPDFMTRERFVSEGPQLLEGRAWSGLGPIERVEVSTDGGAGWTDAELGAALSPHAWRPWRHTWEPPRRGSYELCCRATDATGKTQPLHPDWNLGGYANNAVQRVAVTVR